MAIGAQETIHLRDLLQELGFIQTKPTKLLVDNKSALDLLVSTKNHPKIRHIGIKYHFTRECQANKVLQASYISRNENLADGFTKPLEYHKFNIFRQALGVLPPKNAFKKKKVTIQEGC